MGKATRPGTLRRRFTSGPGGSRQLNRLVYEAPLPPRYIEVASLPALSGSSTDATTRAAKSLKLVHTKIFIVPGLL